MSAEKGEQRTGRALVQDLTDQMAQDGDAVSASFRNWLTNGGPKIVDARFAAVMLFAAEMCASSALAREIFDNSVRVLTSPIEPADSPGRPS